MQKWSLNAKVLFIISILVVGAGFISFLGISGMSGQNEVLKAMMAKEVRSDQLSFLVTIQQRLVIVLTRDIIIERDDAKMAGIEKDIETAKVEILKYLTEFESLASDEGKKITAEYRASYTQWILILNEIIAHAKLNKDDDVRNIIETKERPVRVELLKAIDKMNDLTAKDIEVAMAKNQSDYATSRNFMLLVSVIAILASLIIGALILRALSKTINEIIASLNDNAAQVTTAAEQISAGSQQLSEATTEQAASLEETSSSVEEMNSMVFKTSDNAKKSAEVSQRSQASAKQGKVVVEDMMKAISEINDSNEDVRKQIEESNSQISDIVKVIAEIGEKTKVINDIVFQTKLLSFNASVEAARAGEHGKGFAVVAEEVGNLAQMSGNAAHEISSLLESSIHKVEGIVSQTKEKVEKLITKGRERVNHGTQVAKQCGVVLDDIVENIALVNDMASEISTATNEQSLGVQEITKAISQLDQTTQQNAGTAVETASAAEELASQAVSLKNVVVSLTHAIKGHSSAIETVSSHRPTAPVKEKKSFANVVTLKSKAHKPSIASHSKKAVGSSLEIPSSDDDRFTDV